MTKTACAVIGFLCLILGAIANNTWKKSQLNPQLNLQLITIQSYTSFERNWDKETVDQFTARTTKFLDTMARPGRTLTLRYYVEGERGILGALVITEERVKPGKDTKK